MPVKPDICPHCGHPIASSWASARLVGRQLQFFEIVDRAGQLGIDGRSLRTKLFAGDHDGGPVSVNIIAVMAAQINRKLRPWGVTIRAGRGKGEPYKLRTLA